VTNDRKDGKTSKHAGAAVAERYDESVSAQSPKRLSFFSVSLNHGSVTAKNERSCAKYPHKNV